MEKINSTRRHFEKPIPHNPENELGGAENPVLEQFIREQIIPKLNELDFPGEVQEDLLAKMRAGYARSVATNFEIIRADRGQVVIKNSGSTSYFAPLNSKEEIENLIKDKLQPILDQINDVPERKKDLMKHLLMSRYKEFNQACDEVQLLIDSIQGKKKTIGVNALNKIDLKSSLVNGKEVYGLNLADKNYFKEKIKYDKEEINENIASYALSKLRNPAKE